MLHHWGTSCKSILVVNLHYINEIDYKRDIVDNLSPFVFIVFLGPTMFDDDDEQRPLNLNAKKSETLKKRVYSVTIAIVRPMNQQPMK